MEALLVPVPPGVRFLIGAVLLELALLTLYRGAFWAWFRRTARPLGRAEALQSFGLGTRFDLRLVLLLHLPLLVVGWIPGLEPGRSDAGTALASVWLVATFAAVTLLYLLDAAHYDYLHCRLNATVVEHLDAPGIALRTAFESFPVLRGALVLAALTLLHGACVRALAGATRDPAAAVSAASAAVAWSLVALAFAAGIYGRFAWFPLRWSDAFSTPHPFRSALALNPVLFLWDTWDNRRARGAPDTARAHYPALAAVLGVDAPDPQRLDLTRRIAGRPQPGRPPNVVVVLLESFAAYKVGAFGNRLQPTPHFDALAARSTLLRNFFAVTSPTARAVFTLVTGIPDVNAVHAASRNPLLVRQDTLIDAFTGYRKLYLIGGSASWGNIRGLLAHNVPGLRILEEPDFDAPRVDGWGISDRHLLLEANRRFRELEPPFFALVHTSGNHRPWTIPADRGDFELRPVPARALRENGFDSPEEFQSFRFLDHAVGEFFRQAAQEPYYEDTIFFLLGDHGAGAPHDVPWERLGLTHVHTPLLIHAPRRGPEGRVLDTVGSSLDVLPTALGLAGLPYENRTFGRDLFDASRGSRERYAFVRLVPRHGLVGSDLFLSLKPDGTTALYRHHSARPDVDVSAELPAETAAMADLCRGILETSRVLLDPRSDRGLGSSSAWARGGRRLHLVEPGGRPV